MEKSPTIPSVNKECGTTRDLLLQNSWETVEGPDALELKSPEFTPQTRAHMVRNS